jgi:hypothetical protein
MFRPHRFMPHLCICEECCEARWRAKGEASIHVQAAIAVLVRAGLMREADALGRLIAGDPEMIPGGPTPASTRPVVVHPILIEVA